MSRNKSFNDSFESLFNFYTAIITVFIVLLLTIIFYLSSASLLTIITSTLLSILPILLLSLYVKRAIKTPLFGLSASLEAIRNEDYSLRVNPKFNQGAIKILSDEVSLMANDLRLRKLHYDQHAVLVLNLIEQLATPIAVFDHNGRLTHANDAFSMWCGTPWKQLKYAKANTLGLTFTDNVKQSNTANQNKSPSCWKIKSPSVAQQWQLRYSQLSMQDEHFQLVVLTNIEQVVNKAEQLAWHKMTRVLSHEINNSLSPIKSLAQSLMEMFSQQSLNTNAQQALEVIVSRSDALMQFVNRSTSLTQQFEINVEAIELVPFINKITALFSNNITLLTDIEQVMADRILLEQTLINLVKNAVEASHSDSAIEISIFKSAQYVEIKVIDNGAGIANPDNLFVPFYTTKETGKGIGLALCRNMIEQQGGKLTLHNRTDNNGAIASIKLPT